MTQPTPLRLVLTSVRPSAPATATPPDRLAPGLRFGRFELLVQQRRLLADGQPVALRARAFDLLVVLTAHAGELQIRQQLLDRVWPGLVVEENNLSVQINALRKVLGSDIISTVPGRGYRFTAALASVTLAAVPTLGELPGGLAAVGMRTNLPLVLAPLIGRDADLAALGARVDAHRLVTLLGAAGIGKTRLAQALLHARRGTYPHGVGFVDLARLKPGDSVLATVAASLGLPQPGGDRPLAALVLSLKPLAMLIALDNAEHVLDAVATLATALLADAPRVQLLVTSQTPLRVAEEWLMRLGALTLPAAASSARVALQLGAVALFALRAQALDARFQVTDGNVAQVVELCIRLDGAPLAIELAAARASQMGLGALVAGLDRRLALLTAGRRDAPQRHQTLRAALQWSHDLLSPAEQAVFRRLSVFVGSASLALAQQVLIDDGPGGLDEWAVLDALGALVDRSLLEAVDGPRGAGDPPRYRHLDSPRAFAHEQLCSAGEQAQLLRRHALALRARYEQARDDLFGGRLGCDAWQADLDVDVDNGLAAVAWAVVHDTETALVIAPVISRNIVGRRHADCKALWQAVEPLLDAAIAAQQHQQGGLLARAVCECAVFWINHRIGHARLRAEQALALAEAAGDLLTQYTALSRLAWICGDTDDLDGLMRVMARMRPLHDPSWSPYVQAITSEHAWIAPYLKGDFDASLTCLQDLSAQYNACGYSTLSALSNLTAVLTDAGRVNEAITLGRELVARFANKRHTGPVRAHLNNLIRAYLVQGRTAEARQGQHDLWPYALQYDMLRYWTANAALLAALEQRPRAALALIGRSDAEQAKASPGMARVADDQRLIDRAEGLAVAALSGPVGDAACDLLKRRGASWSESDLAQLAFADVDL